MSDTPRCCIHCDTTRSRMGSLDTAMQIAQLTDRAFEEKLDNHMAEEMVYHEKMAEVLQSIPVIRSHLLWFRLVFGAVVVGFLALSGVVYTEVRLNHDNIMVIRGYFEVGKTNGDKK